MSDTIDGGMDVVGYLSYEIGESPPNITACWLTTLRPSGVPYQPCIFTTCPNVLGFLSPEDKGTASP